MKKLKLDSRGGEQSEREREREKAKQMTIVCEDVETLGRFLSYLVV